MAPIILLDHDMSRGHDLAVIFEFLDEHPVQLKTSDYKESVKHWPDPPPRLAVISIDRQAPEELISALHARDPALPIMLLGEGDPDLLPLDGACSSVISHISFPPGFSKLVDDLHRARLFREQHEFASGKGAQRRQLPLFRDLVGSSRGIQEVRELMQQVAASDVTVLVTGESGTGKEVVARNLHAHSSRRDKPFVPVNCGAIPAELLESELFGHEKGAFTGAVSARTGRLELAQGGTLFLDEIGDMPLPMQVKLLRVLQEKMFERVGGNQTIKADLRIICATHRDLDAMIATGDFREDLYYRINVFPIEIPPLRERVEDIPLLINELVGRLEREQRDSIRFNSAAIMSLCRHEWPGNVRELANLVERMAVMHPCGVVGVRDLPRKFRHIDEAEEDDFDEVLAQIPAQPDSDPVLLPVNGLNLKDHLAEIERGLIEQALADCSGIVARAAERLQLRRTTLVEKMRKFDLLRASEVTED